MRKHMRRHRAEGGFADDGEERLKKAQKRNELLASPNYAKGGKVSRGMKGMYESLHSNLADQPQMKKLKVSKKDVYAGEPHRFRGTSRRSK